MNDDANFLIGYMGLEESIRNSQFGQYPIFNKILRQVSSMILTKADAVTITNTILKILYEEGILNDSHDAKPVGTMPSP